MENNRGQRKIGVLTLGCKVNQYDSEAMSEILTRAGYEVVPFEKAADAYLINTCTVTGTADKKSRQMISRAKKLNPRAVICVAGCLAQRDAKEVAAIPGVDIVLGTGNRARIAEYLEAAFKGRKSFNAVYDISREEQFEDLAVSRSGERTRGYIKICEGCNNFCSYCIVPFARGPVRSRPLEQIADEAKRLVASGVREVVLTGIHIASYGIDMDKQTGLADVIERLDRMPEDMRLRLGSLEPGILTEEFCRRAAACKKLCPHFHVSMQSGSETVLKRMNRHYTPGEYARYIKRLRYFFENPAVTTDVITGFPQESEEEYLETIEFVKDIGFSRIHVFPYSEREGTAAARMKGSVPVPVRKERAARMIEVGQAMEREYAASFVGKEVEVLLEECYDGVCEGYTRRYVKACTAGKQGDLKKIAVTRCEDMILYGDSV